MIFDTIVIGGGLAGLLTGIALQEKGQRTAVLSKGQNALHFFSGSFDSMEAEQTDVCALLKRAGIGTHYSQGWRLMPLGTFKPSCLCLDDVTILPDKKAGDEVLVVGLKGFRDFFPGLLSKGIAASGSKCRTIEVDLPILSQIRRSPSEMRSVNAARALDKETDAFCYRVREALRSEDTVVLPAVFGLNNSLPVHLVRESIPCQVIFTGTLPSSVPGFRTAGMLRTRYERLGGTFVMGDEVVAADIDDSKVKSVSSRNFGSEKLEANSFVLAAGSFLHGGLSSSPDTISEPIFGLDIDAPTDRSQWFSSTFPGGQPFLSFGVKTDDNLRPLKGGTPFANLYAAGAILGGTRPELGSEGGLCLRSAIQVAATISA